MYIVCVCVSLVVLTYLLYPGHPRISEACFFVPSCKNFATWIVLWPGRFSATGFAILCSRSLVFVDLKFLCCAGSCCMCIRLLVAAYVRGIISSSPIRLAHQGAKCLRYFFFPSFSGRSLWLFLPTSVCWISCTHTDMHIRQTSRQSYVLNLMFVNLRARRSRTLSLNNFEGDPVSLPEFSWCIFVIFDVFKTNSFWAYICNYFLMTIFPETCTWSSGATWSVPSVMLAFCTS